MDLSEFRAFVLLPFRINDDKTTLIGGLDYTFIGGPLDNLPADRTIDANLHALRLTTGINQRVGEHWAFRVLVTPTLASDFSGDLDGDAFTLQSSVMVQRITESGWRFGLGAAYTNGFGEPKLVPIGELFFKSDNFDLLVLAPIQTVVRYHMKDIILGFRVDLQGNEYALDKHVERGDFPSMESLKFSRYNLGPTLAYTISDQTRIQFSGGFSIKRKLTGTDIEAETENYDLENGSFFKASLFVGTFGRE